MQNVPFLFKIFKKSLFYLIFFDPPSLGSGLAGPLVTNCSNTHHFYKIVSKGIVCDEENAMSKNSSIRENTVGLCFQMSTVSFLFSHKTGTLSDGIYLDLINPNEVTCNSNEACHMKFKDTVSYVRVLGRIFGLWRKVKVFEEYCITTAYFVSSFFCSVA